VFLSGQAGPAILGGKKHKHHYCSKDTLLPILRKPLQHETCTISNPTIIALPLPHSIHPSIRPRLMLADAGFLNHVQAGQLFIQAGPGRR
jgi:hypothetical protein